MSTIFTLEKIYRAFEVCKRRKTKTANFLKFDLNRDQNLFELCEDLKTKRYIISRHICFVVQKPKPREVFAADFRDRIVHHVLYNEIYEMFDMTFCNRSYANRIGKGTHLAVGDLKNRIKGSTKLFYAKCDIQNFFRSIDRKKLFEIIKIKIASDTTKSSEWKKEILWLIELIIFDEPTDNYVFKGNRDNLKLIEIHKSLFNGVVGKGLPIGNLTSQFFANIYLNELDQFFIKKLKVGKNNYFRYVDDIVLIHYSGRKLFQIIQDANNFLGIHLLLKFHPQKTIIQPILRGVDFLGYFIKPNYVLIRRDVVYRFRYKFYQVLDGNGFVERGDIPMIRSYVGHFGWANSFNLRIKYTI
jgi:RNA-directed DNA polymerase